MKPVRIALIATAAALGALTRLPAGTDLRSLWPIAALVLAAATIVVGTAATLRPGVRTRAGALACGLALLAIPPAAAPVLSLPAALVALVFVAALAPVAAPAIAAPRAGTRSWLLLAAWLAFLPATVLALAFAAPERLSALAELDLVVPLLAACVAWMAAGFVVLIRREAAT